MDEIRNQVETILRLFKKETDNFLDNVEYYRPPQFEICFRGEKVEIPIDWAELNNTISDFLEQLDDDLDEY